MSERPIPMPAKVSPELRARIAAYEAWYHEFDFGDGVLSQPKHPHRDIWAAITQFLEPVDFKGKSVLDIGAWDGYWSFLAEQRGAGSVFATDDNSQHWTRLADGWGASNSSTPGVGFQLAHEALGSRVSYQGDVNIYHLDRLNQQFDLILCLGVFYHLTHLMAALTQLRHTVKPGGTIILEGAAINDERKSAMDFLYGPDDGYNGQGSEPERRDPSNWSIPTIRCLKDMLGACYFEVTRVWYPFDKFLRGRVLVEARPVVVNNPHYDYRPAFGLDRYDTRFGGGATRRTTVDFPNHFREAPSPQHAFDLFKGEWFTRLPDACGWVASTGPARHCEDYRVHWAQDQLGSFAGKRILELGPMEGGHAYMLEQMGASEVISIEANARAFLKCLVLKEAFGLTKTRFQLGDFLAYLRTTSDQYEISFACGVLYHMTDPVELIALLAAHCRSVFIWTHYYDPAYSVTHPHVAASFDSGSPAVTGGFAHTRYRRSYGNASQQPGFCGSDRDACWLTQADILAACRHFGLRVVAVVNEENPNGSALLLAVTRA